MNNFKERNHF